MARILNNVLPWDSSCLGIFPATVIAVTWMAEGAKYYGITLPPEWSPIHPSGTVFCMMTRTKDVLPCIIEDIKPLFGIVKRGLHRITIGSYQYLMYYVPVTNRNELVWETPLNRLKDSNELRKQPEFRKKVQQLIAFCDVLSLKTTGEPAIRIRNTSGGTYNLINVNMTKTSIPDQAVYDFSVITKTLHNKWFGEVTLVSDVVKEMVHYRAGRKGRITVQDNLSQITAELRSKIDIIIETYDPRYIWYTSFIVDRLSRHLLN